MRYIENFREGDNINDVYLVKSRKSDVNKNGKAFEKVILADKTGTIDAMIWDPNSPGIDDFEEFDYVLVVGSVNVYNNTNQIGVKRIRKVEEGEYDTADYVPVSENNIDEMYDKLLGYIDEITSPNLKKLLKSFFVDDKDFAKTFKKSSAAKSVHHGFVGGLLEHTLSVTNMCNYYASAYPMLRKDLLLTVAMLHDIGKTVELSDFPRNDYTDEGQLLGHIVIGSEMVGEHIRQIEGFPKVLETEVKHCILAHHGEYEYGSPKKPALMEAVALHFADNTDAKMETMKELFNSTSEKGWLGFNRMLDSNIRKTSTEE